jgi:hypothetical protein
MVFVQLFGVVVPHVGKGGLLGHREELLDRLLEVALVAFEPQHIVAALGDNLLGDGALAAHGIDGHETPLEIKQLQQLRDRRDLVGLFLRRLLA